MTQLREKTFYDIEHEGDVRKYAIEPLQRAGARVENSSFNNDAEQVTVTFRLKSDDKEEVDRFYDLLKIELAK